MNLGSSGKGEKRIQRNNSYFNKKHYVLRREQTIE